MFARCFRFRSALPSNTLVIRWSISDHNRAQKQLTPLLCDHYLQFLYSSLGGLVLWQARFYCRSRLAKRDCRLLGVGVNFEEVAEARQVEHVLHRFGWAE